MGIPTLIGSAHTASGFSEIAITSGIDSTYDEYMFVLTDINPAEDDRRLLFQCSIDGGSNYDVAIVSTNWRAYNYESAGSPAIQYDTGSDQVGTAFQKFTGTCGNGADESIAGILHLFSPSSTTYVKHFYGRTNTYKQDNVSDVVFVAGYFNDGSNDINAIKFKMDSGDFDGVIQMYGIA